MSDTIATLEKIKVSVNKHLDIFREQLNESAEKLKEHRFKYGDYYYRTEDDPPKTTELVMQSALKDLRLQIKTAIEIIEMVDRITKTTSNSKDLPQSDDTSGKPFDPEKWLKEAGKTKSDNQDDE